MVILSGLLPSSCSSMKGKSPATQQHAPAQTEIATTSKNKDLGELELTNHYETCIQLGAGKSCTIKPSILDHGNLQLVLAFETKKSDGQTDGLSVVQIVTKTGKPFEVAIGDMNFTLTPKLADE